MRKQYGVHALFACKILLLCQKAYKNSPTTLNDEAVFQDTLFCTFQNKPECTTTSALIVCV